MNTGLTSELGEVMEAKYYRPAISIVMPFEPKMNQKAALSHSLKIAADKVERELREAYSTEIIELVMGKLRSVISNLNYNTHKKSIAIYVSPVFEKVLYLDIAVEEKIMVNESFEIRDLVYNKKQSHQYLVLVINGKKSRMFLGNSKTFVKIIADTSSSVYAYINDAPEKVSNFSDNSSRREIIMEKFLHHIDNSLGIILHSYRLPLFVMGPERIVGHFKKLTKHGSAVIEYIYGGYDEANAEELAAVLQPYTAKWKEVKQKELLNQLEDAAGKKQLACGIRNVWREAMNHKGRLLVVEKDYMYAAQHGGSKNVIYMPSKSYSKFSHIKDAVDDVIEKVLEQGGDVEFVEKDVLKDYHHIALVQYY